MTKKSDKELEKEFRKKFKMGEKQNNFLSKQHGKRKHKSKNTINKSMLSSKNAIEGKGELFYV